MCHCSPPHNLELRPPKPRPWASMTPARRMLGVRWESAPQPTQVGLSTFTSTKALGGAGGPDIVMQVDFQYFFYSIITAYPILTIPLKYPPVPQVTAPPATSILKSGWPLSLEAPRFLAQGAWGPGKSASSCGPGRRLSNTQSPFHCNRAQRCLSGLCGQRSG